MTTPLTPPEPFRAGEVLLRVPASGDVDRVTAICRDPDIQRFTNVPVPYRREDAEDFVRISEEQLAAGTGAHLVVVVDDEVVGAVGAGIDPVDAVASVGYWTAPTARGRGITTTATRMLCRWLLDEVGMHRLELHAAATNVGSNAVAARLGFTHEGTMREGMLLSAVADLPAERVDANVWGLLRGELQ